MDAFFKFLNDNTDALNVIAAFLGILLGSGILGLLVRGIWSIWKENRVRKTRSDENFPFKIIPPNSNVAKEILGGNDNDLLADRNIPYQQRVTDRNIRREIEDMLSQNHWVLITGKTGLGKTREAVNIAESLNREGWTILYLTRERWLSAPAKLPVGVPERKLLFILDDLNRKIYASRVEQSPQAKENILQPLNIPLQTRLYESLDVFEKLCGKSEVMVLATARDEKFNEFPDEPSEWDKLEIKKYDDFWKRFSIFTLPEADDDAEISLLTSTIHTADINANSADFPRIAKKNDGTFSNLVENLRTANNRHVPFQESTFRETLKGTWENRYQDAIKKNSFAVYFYDAMELIRAIGLDSSFYMIFWVSNILAKMDVKRLNIIKNFRTLYDLVKRENLLHPRDGQIEAKGYKVDIKAILPKLYKPIFVSAGKSKSKLIRFFKWLVSLNLYIPESALIKDGISLQEKVLALFFDLGYNLNQAGEAFGEFGFQEIEVLCYRKSISLSKWNITNPRKYRLRLM